MNKLFLAVLSIAVFASSPQAWAYKLTGSGPQHFCLADGSECRVYCENGQLAGTMYWNGSTWTDGVKTDPDRDKEARSICDANGSDCV